MELQIVGLAHVAIVCFIARWNTEKKHIYEENEWTLSIIFSFNSLREFKDEKIKFQL